MGKSSTSYTSEGQKGNKNALKWTEEKKLEIFKQVAEIARTDDEVLCLYDAVDKCLMPLTTYDIFAKDFPELGLLKAEAQKQIVRRINKNALFGTFTAAPAIWRMKQLGEKDETTQVTQNVNYNTEITQEEAKRISDALEDEY